jgi:hypothetical protein
MIHHPSLKVPIRAQSRFPWPAEEHFFIAWAQLRAQLKLHGHLRPKWAIWNRTRLCGTLAVHSQSAARRVLLRYSTL